MTSSDSTGPGRGRVRVDRHPHHERDGGSDASVWSPTLYSHCTPSGLPSVSTGVFWHFCGKVWTVVSPE